jgi:NAD(P)-dependent dehydrogenase (short-subunit alcohol dehydrogenase family)
MPSYVITGASRGIGVRLVPIPSPLSLQHANLDEQYAFLQHLSSQPSNTIIGIVRDKASTDEKIAAEGVLKNVHILEADVTDIDALRKAAEETAKLTGGGLDVLINNAAYFGMDSFAKLDVV